MTDLGNRWIDPYGIVVFRDEGIMEMMYKGRDVALTFAEDSNNLQKYNKRVPEDKQIVTYQKPDILKKDFDAYYHDSWFAPEEYMNLDIRQYLLSRCATDEEMDRVEYELQLFEERGMINLLKVMVWLVATFRANGIVWGVGRGSSVASYCLYLIGIHRVNSLKYNLDVEEFLK